MYYRYRTFAERLGPHNAKSIVLHYFGVLALSYSLFSLRAWLVDYTDRCRCEQVMHLFFDFCCVEGCFHEKLDCVPEILNV